ncbi:MAG TPA: molybdenum cofactor biosynthesis protein MoaE [Chthoniobacterales bacterium]|jgi:molybdopterin synthase catalytic subunit|nr:molybdenum cofactor biosynthesis protein MoaE [Chthoniobacterales bacterium]
MAISVCEVSITEAPLVLPAPNDDAQAGAVVVFWGAVRAMEEGREITGIDYEAHREMAEHQMRLVAESAAVKFGLREVFLRHRIGFVATGEPSVVVRVTSGHRGAAFGASQWIMDELKRVVPIWKRPVFKEATVIARV